MCALCRETFWRPVMLIGPFPCPSPWTGTAALEEDAQILKVIEAYCTSAKTRQTLNSSKNNAHKHTHFCCFNTFSLPGLMKCYLRYISHIYTFKCVQGFVCVRSGPYICHLVHCLSLTLLFWPAPANSIFSVCLSLLSLLMHWHPFGCPWPTFIFSWLILLLFPIHFYN